MPGERKNNHCSILQRIIGWIWCCNKAWVTTFGTQKILFHHDNAPAHKVFSRFDPLRLLSVPKLEKMPDWKEILLKWKRNYRNKRVLWGVKRRLLGKRNQAFRNSLEKVYRVGRELCWRINANFLIKMLFYYLGPIIFKRLRIKRNLKWQ